MIARDYEVYVNDHGTKVSALDVDSAIVVWDHHDAVEIGQAGDAESARQMVNG